MAFNFGSKIEGTAYAVLNEIFGVFRGKGGFARPSRYEVILHPPAGTNANITSSQIQEFKGDDTVRQTSLACENISFPGRNIDTTEDTNIYGPVRSIVTGYTYGDVQATFLCSNDRRENLFFEVWQRLTFNPQTWAMGYYNNYVGTIQINQLDQDDDRQYGIALMDCFPKDIGAQDVSQSSNNAISTITVTFSYRYWKSMVDEEQLPKPLDNRTDLGAERVNEVNIPSIFQRLFG